MFCFVCAVSQAIRRLAKNKIFVQIIHNMFKTKKSPCCQELFFFSFTASFEKVSQHNNLFLSDNLCRYFFLHSGDIRHSQRALKVLDQIGCRDG